MTREEAAVNLEQHVRRDNTMMRLTPKDNDAMILAIVALRRLDELEKWAKAHMETIGHYGDPWGEELGVYNTLEAVLKALNGQMEWPEGEEDGKVE